MVAGQGIKGGPLFDMTRAWFNFLRLLVAAMKRGYVMMPPPSPDSSDPGKVLMANWVLGSISPTF